METERPKEIETPLPEGTDYFIGQAIAGILAAKDRNLFNIIDNVDNVSTQIVAAARRIAAEVILQQAMDKPITAQK